MTKSTRARCKTKWKTRRIDAWSEKFRRSYYGRSHNSAHGKCVEMWTLKCLRCSGRPTRYIQRCPIKNEKTRVVCRDFFLRVRSLVSSSWTTPNGIMTRTHLTAQKPTEWQREPSEERKKRQQALLCQVVYQKFGGLQQWNAMVVCESCKTEWQTIVLQAKNVFGKVFDGPIIPYGAFGNYGATCYRSRTRNKQGRFAPAIHL